MFESRQSRSCPLVLQGRGRQLCDDVDIRVQGRAYPAGLGDLGTRPMDRFKARRTKSICFSARLRTLGLYGSRVRLARHPNKRDFATQAHAAPLSCRRARVQGFAARCTGPYRRSAVRTIAEIGSAITKLANAPHSAVMLAICPCHTRRNLEIRERTTCAEHFALWAIR